MPFLLHFLNRMEKLLTSADSTKQAAHVVIRSFSPSNEAKRGDGPKDGFLGQHPPMHEEFHSTSLFASVAHLAHLQPTPYTKHDLLTGRLDCCGSISLHSNK